MARIKLLTLDETSGAERERYEELAGRNAVTNMKKGLLQDAATYDAYMAWYTLDYSQVSGHVFSKNLSRSSCLGLLPV